MNKNKLKELVNALDSLSDEVKDWDVDMNSEEKPMCDTPGCHAGLISIVAKDLPELQEFQGIYYQELQDVYNDDCRVYEYITWHYALAEFLGFEDEQDLKYWAQYNPELWGNKYGYDMFVCQRAFTDDKDKKLTHRDIINHWKQVLVNIERKIKRR
ncbi:hypothetical protein [uncultured Gammaproteobacteria bacterium]|nr:hypothetical protein [uncultured Gammaproteobacteria bacterium]